MKRLGVLVGGGDCPGLNPIIRALVTKAMSAGVEVIGICNGWKGLITNETMPLGRDMVAGTLDRSGCIVGTSRTNPNKKEGDLKKVVEHYRRLKLDALVTIGGQDTLKVAEQLWKEQKIRPIGIPKTIDNDLQATDYTFGFDSAINIATEAIDRVRSTAESHQRIMVIEVMGRYAGWIALYAGIASGADVILIPEIPIDINETCDLIKQRYERGKMFSVVVVAEGARFKQGGDLIVQEEELDGFGHVRLGGIGHVVAEYIEKKTGYETRAVVLGHIQRGGVATALDRVIGTRFGVRAVELALAQKFGVMVALKGPDIVDVPLEQAIHTAKSVPMDFYHLAQNFFG